jgi:PLP dependent protein
MNGTSAGPGAEGWAARLAEVGRRVEASTTDPASIRIVAVTKGFGPEAVRWALDAGLADIGENYADELVGKAALVASGRQAPGSAPGTDAGGSPPVAAPVWHYLGAVQRNKVARLAPLVAWWQGVRRLEEGRAIARRHPGSTVLVQLDVALLPGRGGCPPDRVPELVEGLRDEDLDVAGLMAVGPPGPPEAARPGFALLSSLADSLGLPVRSMGMSDDLEVALSEGSTMLRLGRALFGERPPRAG